MLPVPPDMLGMIATLYGVGAAGAALLQARQVVRRRSSCEVSARFFATYAGGYAVWLLYGLSIESTPLILVDAAGLACGLVTLAHAADARLAATSQHVGIVSGESAESDRRPVWQSSGPASVMAPFTRRQADSARPIHHQRRHHHDHHQERLDC